MSNISLEQAEVDGTGIMPAETVETMYAPRKKRSLKRIFLGHNLRAYKVDEEV